MNVELLVYALSLLLLSVFVPSDRLQLHSPKLCSGLSKGTVACILHITILSLRYFQALPRNYEV